MIRPELQELRFSREKMGIGMARKIRRCRNGVLRAGMLLAVAMAPAGISCAQDRGGPDEPYYPDLEQALMVAQAWDLLATRSRCDLNPRGHGVLALPLSDGYQIVVSVIMPSASPERRPYTPGCYVENADIMCRRGDDVLCELDEASLVWGRHAAPE